MKARDEHLAMCERLGAELRRLGMRKHLEHLARYVAAVRSRRAPTG